MSRDVGTRHVLTDATGKSRARPATHVARRVPGSCVLLGGTQPLLRISQPCCAPDVQQMWPPKRHAAAAACCSNVLLCTASTLCVRRTVSALASLISTDEALPVRAAARGKRRWRMFRARLHRVAFMQNRVTLYTACYACILHMCRQGLYAQMTCVCNHAKRTVQESEEISPESLSHLTTSEQRPTYKTVTVHICIAKPYCKHNIEKLTK